MDGKEGTIIEILKACKANKDTFLTYRNIRDYMDRGEPNKHGLNMTMPVMTLLVKHNFLESRFNGTELEYKITEAGIDSITKLKNDLESDQIQE